MTPATLRAAILAIGSAGAITPTFGDIGGAVFRAASLIGTSPATANRWSMASDTPSAGACPDFLVPWIVLGGRYAAQFRPGAPTLYAALAEIAVGRQLEISREIPAPEEVREMAALLYPGVEYRGHASHQARLAEGLGLSPVTIRKWVVATDKSSYSPPKRPEIGILRAMSAIAAELKMAELPRVATPGKPREMLIAERLGEMLRVSA